MINIRNLSIFTKLLLLGIIAGIVVNLIVFGFFIKSRSHSYGDVLKKNLNNYVNYLVRDIGNPPSYARAKAISRKFNIDIAYYDENTSFSTSDNIPDINELHPHDREAGLGQYKDHIFKIVHKEKAHFIFLITIRRSHRNIIFLIILVTLILVAIYFLIKRILKPIGWLSYGVSRISQGDLTHQIPIKTEDQLGKLARSFNDMTNRVRQMLKLREKLLLDVSHELRSPITRIKLALEFISDIKTKDSISEDIIYLEGMVKELLEVERLKSDYGKLKLKSIDLVLFIKSVITNFPNTNIKFSSDVDSIYADIDSNRMKIVLNNLIDNAIRYSKPNDKAVELIIKESDSSIIIIVKDYGCGIPEAELPYIFEPFYRVDKSRSSETGGYGLGMSLCKKIIEAHKGSIDVVSQVNMGTEVIIHLAKHC